MQCKKCGAYNPEKNDLKECLSCGANLSSNDMNQGKSSGSNSEQANKRFVFQVITPGGQKVKWQCEAADEESAKKRLAEQGLKLISIATVTSMNKELSTALTLATKGQRLGAFLLDLIFYCILCLIFWMVVGFIGSMLSLDAVVQHMNAKVVGIFLYIIYYLSQETFSGRTLGKKIMGTRAVKEDGTKMSFGQVLGRTLCRCIFFDPLTFLCKTDRPRGWHDTISNTAVIHVKG